MQARTGNVQALYKGGIMASSPDTNNDIGSSYMQLTIRDLRKWDYHDLANKLQAELEADLKKLQKEFEEDSRHG